MGQKISITKHSKRETFNLGYSRIISTANISLIFASFLMLIGISLLIYGLIQNKIKCINDFDCIDSKCIDRVCKKDNKSIKKVKTTFIVIGIICILTSLLLGGISIFNFKNLKNKKYILGVGNQIYFQRAQNKVLLPYYGGALVASSILGNRNYNY